MKILDLKLQAFGPFLKEQHIDFTELNDKGMFLINGPTGTGKTSLFDAIVFALYGKGSGKDRDDGKSLRSDFADEDIVTYVNLKFEANGKIYEIYRQPAYTRKAKKGGGTTTEQAKAELTMPDGTIISKPSVVDQKIIDDIIFINRDQFKSVALLAQGEFTELITASSKERAAILEHIFGKEIYDEFQTKITARANEAKEKNNEVISSVNTLIRGVDGGEEIVGYNEALEDPANIPTFIDKLNERISILKEEQKQQEEITNAAQTEFNKVTGRLSVLRTSNQQINNYINAVAKLDELKKQELYISLARLSIEVQNEKNALKPLFGQVQTTQNNIDSANKEIADANKSLEAIKTTNEWLSNHKAEYEGNKAKITDLNKVIPSLKGIVSEKTNLSKKKDELGEMQKQYDRQFEVYKVLTKDFNDLKERFFASSSYNLAQLLEEGKPCPVCGSIHHPEKAHATNPVSEAEYKNAEQKYNKATENLTKAKSKLDNENTAFKTKEQTLIKTLKDNGFEDADIDFIYSDKLDEEISNQKKTLTNLTSFNDDYEKKEKQVSIGETKYNQIIEGAKKSIKTLEENLGNVNREIDEKLQANKNIKTRDNYFNDKFKEINVGEKQKEIDEYINALTSAQTIVKNTPKELVEKGKIDEATLVDEVEEKRKVYNEQNTLNSALINKIGNLETNVKSINETYKKCESAIRRYSSLTELAKIANGSNRMKLSFKMYILADYFDKITAQANRRLSKITNGRYKLVRRDSLGKGNAQQGLDLDVYDMETGKDRPASSLSGGEKFVSALSMALGLSDIIETNHALIQVESIFIDEGFGSLDENYLDMAMKALESLKDDNKTVAIISHVEKLKEYIPDGLEIQKDEVGSKVVFKPNI